MKKVLALVLALCMLVPFAAMAEGEIKMGQAEYAAHGTKCFAVLTVAMEGDTIVGAYIDEFQVMSAEDGVVGVPDSDADFGTNFPEGHGAGFQARQRGVLQRQHGQGRFHGEHRRQL